MKRLAVLMAFASLLSAPGARAQVISVNPNLETGVSPAKAYSFGEIDSVSLFNGLLNVQVPLGQEFHVGGSLSWALRLHNGDLPWHLQSYQQQYTQDNQVLYRTVTWGYPDDKWNAGLGWMLTLGRLTHLDGSAYWSYEAPDSGIHTFYGSLHDGDAEVTGIYYTRDGSYLRLKTSSTDDEVDFPDGTSHHFTPQTGGDPLLTLIKDNFNNWVSIAYNDSAVPPNTDYQGGDTWLIRDSENRSAYIYFKPGAGYQEAGVAGAYPSTATAHQVIAEVNLPAFGNKRARWLFQYLTGDMPRPCGGSYYDAAGPSVNASLLQSVHLENDAGTTLLTWAMNTTKDSGDCSDGGSNGELESVTLPTGGTVRWTRRHWILPHPAVETFGTYKAGVVGDPGIRSGSTATINPGVADRTVVNPSGVVYKTSYTDDVPSDPAAHPKEKTTSMTVYEVDGTTPISRTVTHFNLCFGFPDTTNANCAAWLEYGLPLTRLTAEPGGGPRFLSTEIQKRQDSGTWHTVQTSYLRYERDSTTGTDATLELNRRVASDRVNHWDDETTPPTTDSPVDTVITDRCDFDGLGHYRSARTWNGSVDSNGVSKDPADHTTFTAYNGNKTYLTKCDGTASTDTIIPPSNWILNTYAYTTDAGPSATPKLMTQYCFDSSNGWLSRKRVLGTSVSNPESPVLAADDLVSEYVHDSSGNLSSERYYGASSTNAPPSSTCTASLTSPRYQIDHTWDEGTLATSTYVDASGALGFKSVDRTIDAGTGFISLQREFAGTGDSGVQITLRYDAAGRLTDVERPAGGWTHYQYSTGRVDQYENSNNKSVAEEVPPLAHVYAKFDALGRISEEGREIPDDQSISRTTRQFTTWDALGRKREQTDWDAVTNSGLAKYRTVYQYDVLGRPKSITSPDGSSVTMKYKGSVEMQRTVSVDGHDATTIEDYDDAGRVVSVTEPQPAPAGATNVTTYGYDAAGHLSSVCASASGTSCGQLRSFTYDNRGFLISEHHPENGTTSYDSYDARGHFLRRSISGGGTANDLTFAYDDAERLVSVAETGSAGNPGRTLKSYAFGTSNVPGDSTHSPQYRNGRITAATRHNWIDANTDKKVVETYTYGGIDGRVSARMTEMFDCTSAVTNPCSAATRTFNQTFDYDPVGNVSSLGFPSYAEGSVSTSAWDPRAVTMTRSRGFLTDVQAYGGDNALAWGSNGMLATVSHANGAVDTVTPDGGMQRPKMISVLAKEGSGCTPPVVAADPVDTPLGPSAVVTLAAQFSGDQDFASHPVAVTWYAGTRGVKTTPVTAGVATNNTAGTVESTLTLTSSTTTATTSYWAEAAGCAGVADTAAATVSVCAAPVITTQPANTTVTYGGSVLLSASSSTAGATYQWYKGDPSSSTAIALGGFNSSTATVTPGGTQTYFVTVSNACGTSVKSSGATVTVHPPAPAWTTAKYVPPAPGQTAATVTVQWAPVTAVAVKQYRVRSTCYPPNVYPVLPPATASSASVDVSGLQACLYSVQTIDNQDIGSDTFSPPALATQMVFTDDPLNAVTPTLIRGVHFGELRQAIDAVRAAAGLGPMWSSYAPLTGPVYASQINEMRGAIAQARSLLHLAPAGWSQPVITQGQTTVRASDIMDLRNSVQ